MALGGLGGLGAPYGPWGPFKQKIKKIKAKGGRCRGRIKCWSKQGLWKGIGPFLDPFLKTAEAMPNDTNQKALGGPRRP